MWRRPAKLKINTKGLNIIGRKLRHRIARFNRSRKYIFQDPLARTLNSIKKFLVNDVQARKMYPGIFKKPVNHVFTGRMLNNVKSKMVVVSGDVTEVYFGTFVPYGYVFEVGGFPRNEPMSRLRPWSIHRFGHPFKAAPVKKKIQKIGSLSYPLVTKAWKGNQKNYTNIVLNRYTKILTQ